VYAPHKLTSSHVGSSKRHENRSTSCGSSRSPRLSDSLSRHSVPYGAFSQTDSYS
jgi:hypothetical protein